VPSDQAVLARQAWRVRERELACGASAGFADFISRQSWDAFCTLTFAQRRERCPRCGTPVHRSISRCVACSARIVGMGGTGLSSVSRAHSSWLVRWLRETALERGVARRVTCAGGGTRLGGPWGGAFLKKQKRALPTYVLAIEPHRSGRLHLHALLKYPAMLPALDHTQGWRLWFERYGRATIEHARSQRDITSYVGKYIAKDGELEFSSTFDVPRMPKA